MIKDLLGCPDKKKKERKKVGVGLVRGQLSSVRGQTKTQRIQDLLCSRNISSLAYGKSTIPADKAFLDFLIKSHP
jgi:hypothetical protein